MCVRSRREPVFNEGPFLCEWLLDKGKHSPGNTIMLLETIQCSTVHGHKFHMKLITVFSSKNYTLNDSENDRGLIWHVFMIKYFKKGKDWNEKNKENICVFLSPGVSESFMQECSTKSYGGQWWGEVRIVFLMVTHTQRQRLALLSKVCARRSRIQHQNLEANTLH